MTRTKLPERRANVTRKIKFHYEGGKEAHVLITIGFDANGRAKEVFCADFKTGTTLHAIIMDACLLFSRLLQHEDEAPKDIAATMCEGPSLIGAIARAVSEEDDQDRLEGSADIPVGPDGPDGFTSSLREGRVSADAE